MSNSKFMTENARITDAYAQMYAKRGVNESSKNEGRSLLKSLRGALPIDGRGSDKTGRRLGVRKVLPFEKRDAKNCCGHYVPLKKNRQFQKITNNFVNMGGCRDCGGEEYSTGMKKRLGVRKVLPFEKRDGRPTSIGRIRNVKNVSAVKGVRESADDFEEIKDVETVSCEDCSKRDEVLNLVLSTFEQIYDNLSDDDKETVDEVKVEIESVLNPEEDEEDGEMDDVNADDHGDSEDGIGESVVNEGAKDKIIKDVTKKVSDKLAKNATKKGVKGATKKGVKGATKKGAVDASKKGAGDVTKEMFEGAKAKFKSELDRLAAEKVAKNGLSKRAAYSEAIRELVPTWTARYPKLMAHGDWKAWLGTLVAAAVAGKVGYETLAGGGNNPPPPGPPNGGGTNPPFGPHTGNTTDAIDPETFAMWSAATSAASGDTGSEETFERYMVDQHGIPLDPKLRRKMLERLRAEEELNARRNGTSYGGGNGGSGRGIIDQVGDLPGNLLGGIGDAVGRIGTGIGNGVGGLLTGVTNGVEHVATAPTRMYRDSRRNIRGADYGIDADSADREYELRIKRDDERERMKLQREEEQARREAEQKRSGNDGSIQQEQSAAAPQTTDSTTTTSPEPKDNPEEKTEGETK